MDLTSIISLSASFTILLINIYGLVRIYTRISNTLNDHANEIDFLKNLKSEQDKLKSDYLNMKQRQDKNTNRIENLEHADKNLNQWMKEISSSMQSMKDDLHKELVKSSDRQYQQIEKLRGEINELYRMNSKKGG